MLEGCLYLEVNYGGWGKLESTQNWSFLRSTEDWHWIVKVHLKHTVVHHQSWKVSMWKHCTWTDCGKEIAPLDCSVHNPRFSFSLKDKGVVDTIAQMYQVADPLVLRLHLKILDLQLFDFLLLGLLLEGSRVSLSKCVCYPVWGPSYHPPS